jgi:hypothetical protein
MVILDEDGGAQVVPMVSASSDPNGIAFERSQSGSGLASVGDPRPGARGNRVDVRTCLRRNAAHALRKIEGRALGHQYRPSTTSDGPKTCAAGSVRSLGGMRLYDQQWVDAGEDALENRPAANDERLARNRMRSGRRVPIDAGFRGHITGREILFERESDNAIDDEDR